MKQEDLIKAKKEALRFIEAADEALDKSFYWHEFANSAGGFVCTKNHQYTAAAKRASMDLTRALVKVRGTNS